jgi:hypothetical protein
MGLVKVVYGMMLVIEVFIGVIWCRGDDGGLAPCIIAVEIGNVDVT